MKTAIVPAQITTVEDKVAGNLSVQQLILLVTPLFISGGVFALLPPSFGIVIYKIVIVSVVALICLAAAIRVRGTLLVYWIARLLRYTLRPRIYVYRRNDTALRTTIRVPKAVPNKVVEEPAQRVPKQATSFAAQLHTDSNLTLAIKKGGLHVSYVKEK